MPKQRSAVKQDLQVFNAAADAATACNFNAAVRVLNLSKLNVQERNIAGVEENVKEREGDSERCNDRMSDRKTCLYIRLNWLPCRKKNHFIEVITMRFVYYIKCVYAMHII